jgi:hypothetical protein
MYYDFYDGMASGLRSIWLYARWTRRLIEAIPSNQFKFTSLKGRASIRGNSLIYIVLGVKMSSYLRSMSTTC